MIVCRRCSRRHPDGTEFCTCGAYLEFEGEVAVEPEAPTPSTPERSEPAAETPDSPAPVGSYEPAPWSGLPTSTPQGSPPDDSMAVLPSEVVRRDLAEQHAPLRGGRPDDIVCASCGAPNPPGSTLCRRCGADLTHASRIVAEDPGRSKRRSWFRRDRPNAGGVTQQVRRRRGVARRVMLMRAGGAVAIVAVLLAMLGPWGGRARSQLSSGLQLDRLNRYDQIEVDPDDVLAVSPDGIEAPNVDYPYQAPGLVVDRLSNTAWATRWVDAADLGEGVGEEGTDGECLPWRTEQLLVVDFGPAIDVDRVQVLGGRLDDDPTRDDFFRPRVLQFEHDGECRLVTLDDEGVLTARDLRLRDATRITVGIVAVFDADTTDPTVEITELVFERS